MSSKSGNISKKIMKFIKISLAVLCLLCLLNMPYGYYELFRVFAMCSFVFLAYKERRKDIWLLLWIVSAILVQPFYKFIIVKEIWNIIDILWAFLLIWSLKKKL